jgi:hypothetical protein
MRSSSSKAFFSEFRVDGRQTGTCNRSCPRMAVRKPSIHFSAAISAKNNRWFDWFVIGEKKNWGEARRRTRFCRMLLYEIKSCQ